MKFLSALCNFTKANALGQKGVLYLYRVAVCDIIYLSNAWYLRVAKLWQQEEFLLIVTNRPCIG